MTALIGVAGRRWGQGDRRRTSWFLALGVGLAGWSLAIGLSPAAEVVTHQGLADLARNLASGLFLVAGVLTLAGWRLSADPPAARRAIALLVLGAGVPGAAAIGPLLGEPASYAHSAPSTRALFLVAVIALLLPGAQWSRQSHRHPLPIGYAVTVALLVATILAGLLVARQRLPEAWLPSAWRVVVAAALLGWLVLAYRAARDSLGRAQSAGRSPVPAFILLAAAELVRLVAMDGTGAVVGIAPGFQLAAAGVLVLNASGDLRAAYRGEEEHTADLARAIAELHGHLVAVESAERERLHDARSALIGVIGASELLDAAGSSAGGSAGLGIDPRQLRRLITAELRRLQGVLAPRDGEEIGEFDLAAALAPVVQVHRLDGQSISTDVESISVLGRAGATATVLDNLLRNACRHAPRANVVVRAQVVGDSATIVVEDDGPGIPEAERAGVLRPGVRGSTARGAGDGLGLSSARAAMAEQGGSLRLDPREGGGTRVTLELPVARWGDVLAGHP